MIAERRDRIRTVRVFGTTADPLALRIQLERELSTFTLMPPGVPPGAVLCVRRLRVTSAAHARAWPKQLDGQLLELLHGVARPLHEAVPADAAAVLFLDEAELLACLARDAALGVAHGWWWRSLFTVPVDRDLVVRELLNAPHAVPAALALLARSDQIVAVLDALPEQACERIGAAVAAAFAVAHWPATHARTEPAAQNGDDVPSVDVMHTIARARAVLLLECAGYASRALPPPQRALLGLCILLLHAPALARSAPVLHALEREEWTIAPPPAPPPPLHARTASSSPGDARQDRSNATGGTDRPGTTQAAPAAAAAGAVVAPTEAARTGDMARVPQESTQPAPPSPLTSTPARLSVNASHDIAPAYVPSEYAGVFYLVNAAIALELYGDFTQPLRPGIALPLGDFLALAGGRACGAAFRRDPVWPLLAQLAGRDAHERPGAGFMAARPLQQWLTEVTTRMERRAALALGTAPRATLRYLCARAGRIALTPTRVDVVFPLASHPLPIRMAGLDRNPGWVPAAGRIVEFYYEQP